MSVITRGVWKVRAMPWAAYRCGPVAAAVVFSLLSETLRLQLPYGYMMVLGLLLILCVMYLPNGLATLWTARQGQRHE